MLVAGVEMTEKQRRHLDTVARRLEKCSGDCSHCEKCHYYFAQNDRAIYMSVGCDLLPQKSYGNIADYPSQLHAAAREAIKADIEAYDETAEILRRKAEKARYTEQQAEAMLSRLIYAELCKACNN